MLKKLKALLDNNILFLISLFNIYLSNLIKDNYSFSYIWYVVENVRQDYHKK